MYTRGSIKLIVLFENLFWVGIFERLDDNGYSVARKIFGDEPSDAEVFHFLLNETDFLRFTTPLQGEEVAIKKKNPKRVLREAMKEKNKTNLTSKAQEALRVELEKNKKVKKTKNREEELERKRKLFIQKQELKKKKKRGH